MALVRIIPATSAHLAAFLRDPDDLSALLGSPLPDGWPEFPEAFPHTLGRLESHPDEADWWMHFFCDSETGVLVGSGGFAGKPAHRQVEIGYEVAPAFRRRGYATASVRTLTAKAISSSEVDRIVADTLAADQRSAGVLRATGFTETGHITHPDDGDLVRWVRQVNLPR